jgi:hypothetical protein
MQQVSTQIYCKPSRAACSAQNWIEYNYDELNQGLWAKIDGHSKLYFFHLTRLAPDGSPFHTLLQEHSWDGMVITYTDEPEDQRWMTVIVLHKAGFVYERIGTVYNIECEGFFWLERTNIRPYPVVKKRILLG